MEHIANAWGDLLVLLIVLCKIDKLTLLNTKLIDTLIKINYSLSTIRRCQDSRERGKGDWHWLFTNDIYIDCLYHRQGNEQKQVAVNTKFKILINQDTKFIKKISFNFKIFISFQTGLNFPLLFGATFLLKMTVTSPQIYTSYNITWFQHMHRSNVNKHSLSASSHE